MGSPDNLKPEKVPFPLSDKEIMFAVRDGKIERLSLLFERYNVNLYNYFLRLTYNASLSEDLVQEVFLKLIKYRQTYRGEGVFTTWMFQIAHNTFYDYTRKKKPHQSIEDTAFEIADDTDIGESLAKKEDLIRLKKAISRLPEDYREVLVLRIYRNMKYKDIAEMMNCPVGTIKARVFHGIRKLKKEMS